MVPQALMVGDALWRSRGLGGGRERSGAGEEEGWGGLAAESAALPAARVGGPGTGGCDGVKCIWEVITVELSWKSTTSF